MQWCGCYKNVQVSVSKAATLYEGVDEFSHLYNSQVLWFL